MDAEERKKLVVEAAVGKQELKGWERDFALENGGKKPRRQDIKQNPGIAQKYKDYTRLNDLISGRAPKPESNPQSSKPTSSKPRKSIETDEPILPALPRPAKRAAPPPPTRLTPSKRRAVESTTTPSSQGRFISATDQYESPSIIRSLFTPQKPVVIGPTPQKDGKLLGLFDLLPSGDEESPVKDSLVNTTPSKKTGPIIGDDVMATPTGAKHSRTPRSSGKRFLLDAFMTPLKRRLSASRGQGASRKTSLTPSSVSKLNFSTPAFLRRDTGGFSGKLEVIGEEDEVEGDIKSPPSPPRPRGPSRPLVRGLSAMLRGLRDMQDTALDDDEEAMREMEGGMYGPPPPKIAGAIKPKSPGRPTAGAPGARELPKMAPLPDVQVEDSQTANPFMEFPDLAYPDDEEELNEVEKAMIERDSNLAVYKKKGQKRTTRRHNMKPVQPKFKAPPKKMKASTSMVEVMDEDDCPPDEEVHGLRGENGEAVIPDTQAMFTADSLPLYESTKNFDSESDDGTEYTASIGGTRYKRAKRHGDYKRNGEDEGRKQKVGAQVHTNYQRLKLRNTGAKGGRVGGRFGKRR